MAEGYERGERQEGELCALRPVDVGVDRYFVFCIVRSHRSEIGSKREVIRITSYFTSPRRQVLTKCIVTRPTLSQPSPHPGVLAGSCRCPLHEVGREATAYLPLDVEFNISLCRKDVPTRGP